MVTIQSYRPGRAPPTSPVWDDLPCTRTSTHATRTVQRCSMDTEGQDVPLLSPLPGTADSIKVFPFIVHLKRDVIVSQRQLGLPFSLQPSFFALHPYLVWNW